MKKIFAGIILLLLVSTIAWSKPPVKIAQLKCDYLTNPLTIDNPHPALNWQMMSADIGKSQKAYRVIVASSLSLLAQNNGDYWDSGVVHSTNSTQIIYRGKPLGSKTKVYWKVMIWDENNQPSAWSQPASWATGLLKPTDWTAKWIGAFKDLYPDSAITYPSPFFRKEFTATKKIKQATVYISGLGFYELYLNGQKIGDQVLAPAVTNYDQRTLKKLLYPYDDQSTQRVLYNTFDVTNNISQSNNAIGILLGNGWYNQRDRTVEGHMWYDLPKLIFQLEITYTDGTTKVIASDNSWKTITGSLLKDGIFTGENYDARLSLGEWNKINYDDAKWQTAIFVKPPTGALHPQAAPFDKVTRVLKPVLTSTENAVYHYQLDETVAGWASITVKGKAGDKIKIRYISEEGEDYGQVDTYTLKGDGTETWEPRFTWHAFRRIEVTSPGVQLDGERIWVKEVHTDVIPNGSFECSNPFLNKIYTAYLKTQKANLHGSLSSDCPHRERLGYTGDGQVGMESALLSFNMPQFYSKWINDIDDARNKKTGFVTHTAPFAGGGGGPAWGSAYVIMPWLYFTYYGDTTLLKHHYAGMKQWVEYLQTRTDKNGLISHEEPNGWCLGDWCTPDNIQIPEPLVNTAYFYHVADLMAKIAGILGKNEDQTKFAILAGQIQVNFNKAYFNASTNTYWQGRQGSDVFALAFGLVPKEKYRFVFNALLDHLNKINYHFDTGILGTPLLLKVLSQNGRDDIAYKIMDQKDSPGFGYLLDSKNSTLWEEWKGGGSHSHPMFGSVITWFYSAIGGIRPDPANTGWKHFTIEPKPVADLTYCKSSYNSLFGKIRSEWKKDDKGGLDVLVEVPANSSATFTLPGEYKSAKGVDGKNILVKKLNGEYVVEFKSGVYQFRVR
ncbi:Bacterial alpha-L-rhamnosidase [Mucilaginibacter corticis]|uniref:alpha-L-rhamnosidase n=1 Tax=Mucilaginibacter corticis TaxID=2597670 RepID=A0A556MG09_9SPHI|nr:family 78 glycoside hydrolase catalytic domain [Mucilaginibacter corticis]TSJ38810.1 Bacterial alpha-L-rhamnosidase [Mucilaginibacter corticis]